MKLRRMVSCMMALLLVCSLPLSAFADIWYLENGDISVNATESGQNVSQGAQVNVPDSAPVITQSNSSTPTTNTVTINAAENATANVTIQDVNIVVSDDTPKNHSGEAAVTIDVADNASANVTLDGVNIDVSATGGYDKLQGKYVSGEAAVQITGNGDATIELDGENTVRSGYDRAGVEKNTTAATETEPANGTGKLTITGENEIHGSLTATGGAGSSGIGGGAYGTGSNITITGSAEVTAQGGIAGSGIGGGYEGSGSEITVEGNAKVTAKSGMCGSGIGGGEGGDGSNITITGSAQVDADAYVEGHGGHDGGSGIGGGVEGSGSNITISGNAVVIATGHDHASGIGGGHKGSGSDITITGSAKVNAQGGRAGSGIGGGNRGSGSNITISGSAEVTATGGTYAAGIGGGYYSGGSSNITVSEDAQVKAQGGNGSAYTGEGTAIGDGGAPNQDGQKVTPNTNDLKEGWIATYAPGTENMNTATPKSLTYKDASGIVQTEKDPLNIQLVGEQPATSTAHGHKAGFQIGNQMVAVTIHSFTNYASDNNATYDADGTKTAKCDHCDATHTIPDPGSKLVREESVQTIQTVQTIQPLYRVLGKDGKTLAFKKTQSNGVLTITVDADYATLTGSLGGLNTLRSQGVEIIVFETNGAASTFAISDLLAQGNSGNTYQLTHDGKTVTFTLGANIGNILK